jgi:hypothetical protein
MTLHLRVIHKFIKSSIFVPIMLLIFGGVSYGVLIPFMGYYGDDWSYVWLAYRSHHLEIFFSGNRPLLAYYFLAITKIIGPAPWHWQVYGFACHWLSAVVFWRLISTIWPLKKDLAAAAATLLLLYPGFLDSNEALTEQVWFLQLAIFLVSLLATIYSLRRPNQALFWSTLALTGAFLNLVISEYWFFLELIRLALILFELAAQEPDRRRLIHHTLLRWLPFLIILASILFVRALDLGGINSANSITLFAALVKNPATALLGLVSKIARDLWFTTLGCFGHAFTLPGLAGRSVSVKVLIVILLLAMGILAFLWIRSLEKWSEDPASGSTRTTRGYLLAGLACLLLGGLPLWITNLQIAQDATSSRLSLPFMPAACLFVAGLTSLVFRSWIKTTVFAALIAFSVVFQLLTGSNFIHEKSVQENFLWQLALRMPSIKPGTQLVTENLGLHFNSQNSNSAMVNWMYTPPEAASQNLQYYLYQFSEQAKRASDQIQPEQMLPEAHMIGNFSGSYQIALDFPPSACLRVLDPYLDEHNPNLSPMEQKAAKKTDIEAIQPAAPGSPLPHPPVEIFGNDPPPDNWCAAFEKASLAGQLGDWAQVTQIADRAYSRGYKPNNAMELVVFIEGYAYQGNWERSANLLKQADKLNHELIPILCRLKQRLISNTLPSSGRDKALAVLNCPSN